MPVRERDWVGGFDRAKDSRRMFAKGEGSGAGTEEED